MSVIKIENGVCWKCWLKYREFRSCCAICGAQLLPFIEATKFYQGFIGLRNAAVDEGGGAILVQGELFQDDE
jgi:hypothetical protein